MGAAFRIFTTAAFDRSIKRLAKKNPDIPDLFEDLIRILEPTRRTRRDSTALKN
jgi:hypothetical protein